MRVGFNLLYLVPGEVGGSELYARELLSAIHALEPPMLCSCLRLFRTYYNRWSDPSRDETPRPEGAGGRTPCPLGGGETFAGNPVSRVSCCDP